MDIQNIKRVANILLNFNNLPQSIVNDKTKNLTF